jgi:hypothetical protein
METPTRLRHLTTSPDIEANRGVQAGCFEKVPTHGGGAALRYRIALTGLTGR